MFYIKFLLFFTNFTPNILEKQLKPRILCNINYMEENFGTRLKDLRQEKNLGQVALAKQLNVGKSIISAWEIGKSEPTLSNLIKIAKFFDTTIDYLAGLEK